MMIVTGGGCDDDSDRWLWCPEQGKQKIVEISSLRTNHSVEFIKMLILNNKIKYSIQR